MDIRIIDKDSRFIDALMAGMASRRSFVDQFPEHFPQTKADILGGNADQLADLINLCFWTSLAVEEGRPVRGVLCLCSPEQAQLRRILAEPVPVSVKNLVTLLTASPTSPLAIHAGDSGTVIWGIIDSAPTATLRIRIASVGTVIASSDEGVVAILHGGTIHIPNRANETQLMSLVARAFDPVRPSRERLELAACLLRIVATMHKHAHGGMLAVVPGGSVSSLESSISFPFKFDDASARVLQDRLRGWKIGRIDKKPVHERIDRATLGLRLEMESASRDMLYATLRGMGDLTSIDGALVLDDELTVLGFGAKLQTPPADFKLTLINAIDSNQTKEVSCVDLGNTRHQSAARFVYHHRDAFVFVSSQDGRLTLIVWIANLGAVVAIQNLEHFIWEYDL